MSKRTPVAGTGRKRGGSSQRDRFRATGYESSKECANPKILKIIRNHHKADARRRAGK